MLEISAPLSEMEALQTNPVVLAFLGDAVYSLWVRERLVKTGSNKPAELQRSATALESARGQSAYLEKLLPVFTQREEEIFRRGRNAKKATKSKHATPAEYNRSTGFEAVIGYLYLVGNTTRIETILSLINEERLQVQALPTAYKP